MTDADENDREPGFRHIGEIIAAQKAKIERALAECDEPAAAEAHEDLIQAEHELRMRQSARKYARRAEG